MARKGRFGEQAPTDYAGNVLKQINQMNSTGETASPAGTTDGTATKVKARDKRAAYTAEEIAADPWKSTVKNALSTMSYEQALANYRALTKVSNMLPIGGFTSAKDKYNYQQAYSALTPEQKNAETIFFGMGGSLKSNDPKYGGYGMGTVNTGLYSSLGVTAPTTSYAPVNFDVVGLDKNFKLANPLNATQQERLKNLRSISKSGGTLTAKQTAALGRLKAKKNAPTILP